MANLQIVPAGRNVEPQYVEMMVPLYSYGCERKVNKALSHIKGIYSVTVWGICNKYDVLSEQKERGSFLESRKQQHGQNARIRNIKSFSLPN